MDNRPTRGPVRIAVIGAGQAGAITLRRLRARTDFEVVGVVEPDDRLREIIASQDLAVSASIDDLPDGLDAVYIATPTVHHHSHALSCLRRGLGVLVEKPLAGDIVQAQEVCDTARRHESLLMVCHKRSVDPGIRTMRRLCIAGDIGDLRAVTMLHWNDWVYRGRRPDELRASAGGGAVYRQGSHHFDMLRYLVGSPARTVSGEVGDWDPELPADGAFTATVRFDNNVTGTISFSGYGGFGPQDMVAGSTLPLLSSGEYQLGDDHDLAGAGPADRKRARAAAVLADNGTSRNSQPVFGTTIVSGTKGSLREVEGGIEVITEGRRVRTSLDLGGDGLDEILDEFSAAIRIETEPTHNGEWGLSVMEMCLAVYQSAESGRSQRLEFQH